MFMYVFLLSYDSVFAVNGMCWGIIKLTDEVIIPESKSSKNKKNTAQKHKRDNLLLQINKIAETRPS